MKKKIKIEKNKRQVIVETDDATVLEIVDSRGVVIGGESAEQLSGPSIFLLNQGEYEIVCDGKIKSMELMAEDKTVMPGLELTSDAEDIHPVDGVGEIPADGKSHCTIFVKKVDQKGKPLTRKKDNDELYIRTTHGKIMDKQGEDEIRKIKLNKGASSFRLFAETEKRLARVRVFGSESSLSSSIVIEFK